jgi:dihydroxyacetone kinase DhaKLM complex PTS-EIIA-like component DhaM
MSMRRQINWPAMQRDMKRYRSPEQMLIREMAEALKAARGLLRGYIGEPIDKIDAVIAKAERHTNV